jgi:hypothetical protein
LLGSKTYSGLSNPNESQAVGFLQKHKKCLHFISASARIRT